MEGGRGQRKKQGWVKGMGRARAAFGHREARTAMKDSDQFAVFVVVFPQSEIDLFTSISPRPPCLPLLHRRRRITPSSKFSRQRKRRERRGNLFSGYGGRPLASFHDVSHLAGSFDGWGFHCDSNLGPMDTKLVNLRYIYIQTGLAFDIDHLTWY